MLLVAVEFRVDPQHRERFAAAADALTGPTREEPGCSFFEFWSDLDASGRFLVYEGWQGPEDLLAHRTTPHVAAFKQAIGELGMQGTTASYYEAKETSV